MPIAEQQLSLLGGATPAPSGSWPPRHRVKPPVVLQVKDGKTMYVATVAP